MSSSLDRRRRALREEERRLWEAVAETVTPLEAPCRRDRSAASDETIPPPTVAAAPPRPEDPPTITPPQSPPADPTSPPAAPTPSKRARRGWTRLARTDHHVAPGDAAMLPRPPALAPIDDRTRRRLVRGVMAIDERLDLHGHTQESAHAILRRFLVGARDRGARIVLVVTGKGKPTGDGARQHDRGVLRRSVPHWLADPSLRDVVVGFEEAHLAHGGAGAIYVRLRRRRDRAGEGER